MKVSWTLPFYLYCFEIYFLTQKNQNIANSYSTYDWRFVEDHNPMNQILCAKFDSDHFSRNSVKLNSKGNSKNPMEDQYIYSV